MPSPTLWEPRGQKAGQPTSTLGWLNKPSVPAVPHHQFWLGHRALVPTSPQTPPLQTRKPNPHPSQIKYPYCNCNTIKSKDWLIYLNNNPWNIPYSIPSGYITDWFIFSWPINGRNVHNYTSCRTLSHCQTLIPRILELWMILNFPENLPQLDLSFLHVCSMIYYERRFAFKSIQTACRF